MSKTISMDFDGVIHDYRDGWTGYRPTGEPIPGAREFILEMIEQDAEVVICSCRADAPIGKECIREWLSLNGFPADRITVTSEKPHADVYIDDRALRFEGCYQQVRDQLHRPVWFKKHPRAPEKD